MEPGVVRHTLEPVFDARSRVLVLGTMPSPASRARGFYYGHPRNRFWRVMERLFSLPDHALEGNDERRAFLLEHGIALWDVLASCSIAGASDASIRDATPNDLRRVTEAAPIARMFATGATAGRLYRRLCEADVGLPVEVLPSTSPANARMRLPDLVRAYRPVAEALAQPPAASAGSPPGPASAAASPAMPLAQAAPPAWPPPADGAPASRAVL